jgi:hypothetical protein
VDSSPFMPPHKSPILWDSLGWCDPGLAHTYSKKSLAAAYLRR